MERIYNVYFGQVLNANGSLLSHLVARLNK